MPPPPSAAASVVHPDASGEGLTVFVKGAADVLLTRCTRELVGGESRALDEERRARIASDVEHMASGALRTIGVARRTIERPSHADAGSGLERDLEFLGVVGMMDPPRPESREAVSTAQAAGVRVILITGDHPATASAIAAELGIAPADAAVTTGHDIDALDEDGLQHLVGQTTAYARVSPEHKLRVVQALEHQDQIVAMTGDGVNDAPALKAADIGIAMGIAGTEVAKQAADMVLADDNFATIVTAIEQGRTIFSNIRKVIRYLLSSNVGEVLTIFLAVVFAGAIGLRPGGSFTARCSRRRSSDQPAHRRAPALALAWTARSGTHGRSPGRPGTPDRRDMSLSMLVVGFDGLGHAPDLRRGAPGRLHRGPWRGRSRAHDGLHRHGVRPALQRLQRPLRPNERVHGDVRQQTRVGGRCAVGRSPGSGRQCATPERCLRNHAVGSDRLGGLRGGGQSGPVDGRTLEDRQTSRSGHAHPSS
jgi:soluble P-type ATPase